MDKLSLVIPVLIVVLIIRQFMPKAVTRFDLIGLPALGLYKTYTGLPDTLSMPIIAELACLIAWAAFIGYYQAVKTKVVHHQGHLSVIGGSHYLIAWGVLLIGRMVILLAFHFNVFMDALHIGRDRDPFADEVLQLVTQSGNWLIWSSVAASSALYSLTLYRLHPDIRRFLSSRSQS